MCELKPSLISQLMKPTISLPILGGDIEYTTRSGRCYGLEELEKKKGKGKASRKW